MIDIFCNADAERSVIGAMLQDADAVKLAAEALTAQDFADTANAMVFDAILALRADKTPVDTMTVSDKLQVLGTYDAAGGAAYLLATVRFVPSTANVRSYIAIVKAAAQRRNLDALLRNTRERLATTAEDISGIVDELRIKLRGVDTTDGGGDIVRAAQIAAEVFDVLDHRAKGEGSALKWGLPDLDAITGGIYKGELTIIGARPGVGKSALALEIALYAAQHGKRVLIDSREMASIQFGDRLVSRMADIDGLRIRTGKLKADDWQRVADASNQLAVLPLSFAFGAASIQALRRAVQKELDGKGLDLLIVDYLQLLTTELKTSSRYEAVGQISRGLKALTLDFGLPVIALAQVKRSGQRAATMPILDDLRESGDLEQDADNVIFLHHPDTSGDKTVPDRDKQLYTMLEARGHKYTLLQVAKARQGKLFTFALDFDPSRMSFRYFERN